MRIVLSLDVDDAMEDLVLRELEMSKAVSPDLFMALRTEDVEVILTQGITFSGRLVDVERGLS